MSVRPRQCCTQFPNGIALRSASDETDKTTYMPDHNSLQCQFHLPNSDERFDPLKSGFIRTSLAYEAHLLSSNILIQMC